MSELDSENTFLKREFENYKINIRDAGEKDSLYMVDVDIDVDMTWTKNPIERNEKSNYKYSR